jgi:hypothetical protein
LGFSIPRFIRRIVGSRIGIATDLENVPSDSDPNYPTIRVDGRGAGLPVGAWRRPLPSLPTIIAWFERRRRCDLLIREGGDLGNPDNVP